MSDYESHPNREPVTWWRGYPIYTPLFLVIIHTVALVLCAVALAMRQRVLLSVLAFSSHQFLHGKLWQPLTYGFIHEPEGALWFAIEMYMLWRFGTELERFFGRKIFLRLYALLWFIPPAVLLLISFGGAQIAVGSGDVHFAIFVAFAALYPNAQMFFGIAAKWMALIWVGIVSIQTMANGDVTSLFLFLASVAAAWFYVRWAKGEISLPSFRFPSRRPKLRVVPKPAPPVRTPRPAATTAEEEDVDALLDKIARSGMSSLSPSERARLERASAELKKERDR